MILGWWPHSQPTFLWKAVTVPFISLLGATLLEKVLAGFEYLGEDYVGGL